MIVGEISSNHKGSLAVARRLVEEIANSGAKFVKFQTFTANTMTLDIRDRHFEVTGSHKLWGGKSLYSLYDEAHTPWAWHAELFELSRELGITPFSTPFDRSAVDFLESLGTSHYKIASLEILDTPLIEYVAQTGKPMIISTGTADLMEVDDAVEAAYSGGCVDLTLLVCTSSYPALPSDVHLRRMDTLRARYSVPVGLSDHTLGLGSSIAAVALGATMVERHVTLDRSTGGLDAAFSLEPHELKQLVKEVRAAFESLGSSDWITIPAEHESHRLRRSLYVVKDVVEGDTVSIDNVRAIRPGFGLPPRFLSQLIDRKFRHGAQAGTPMKWELLETEMSS